jgi:PAS domain S-box-containing protein
LEKILHVGSVVAYNVVYRRAAAAIQKMNSYSIFLLLLCAFTLGGLILCGTANSREAVSLYCWFIAAAVVGIAATVLIQHNRSKKRAEALKQIAVNVLTADELVKDEVVLVSRVVQSVTALMRESSRKQSSLLQHAVDVLCSVDAEGRILTVNPAAQRVWGYAPEDMIGRELTEYILPGDVQQTKSVLSGAEQSVDTLSFENRLRRRDGRVIDLLWSAHWSITDQSLFCVAHDITERKTVERMLKESEHRIREIFDHMPTGLLIVNSKKFIEFANPALEELSGFVGVELVATSIGDLFPGQNVVDSVGMPDAAEGAVSIECLLQQKSGANIPVQLTVRTTKIQDAEKSLVTVLDLREREELEKAKRQFVAMVSHDLRSPLTSLRLSMTLLKMESVATLSAKGKLVVERCASEMDRLIELVNDLLELEKMKAGKFTFHLQPTNVDDVVTASINAVRHLAERRRISFSYKLSRLVCFSDGGRVIQVLVNLLSNSTKFAPADSTIHIETTVEDKDVCFSIKDDGPGVPSAKRVAVFERYEQAKSDDSSHPAGTGLGLAICAIIVQQLGGKIWIHGEPGNEFRFTVPTGEDEDRNAVSGTET